MDRPQPVSIELKRDLQNLRELNRWFGSHALVLQFARRWIKRGHSLRMVDLATASGDIPRLVVDHARAVGARIDIVAVEQNGATLEIARNLSAAYPEITFVQADMRQWQPNESFDIVLCSLVLHHFSEEDAVHVLRRCRALSRQRVLVSDLRRGLLAYAGVYFLTALVFRDPMTKCDARLSAARAFSFGEMQDLARRAGWTNFRHSNFRWARQAVWLE